MVCRRRQFCFITFDRTIIAPKTHYAIKQTNIVDFPSSGSKTLFEKLRILRKNIAEKNGLPAFVIFGVGEHKAKTFGEQFTIAIKEFLENPEEELNIKSKSKVIDNQEETYMSRQKKIYAKAYAAWTLPWCCRNR